MMDKIKYFAAAGLTALAASPVFALEAPAPTGPAMAAAEAATTIAKGDTAFMIIATVLVMLMIVPGLALFYGGLARTKNMASVLTQVLGVACLAELLNTSFYFINQLVSALLNIMLTEKIIYPGDTCFVLRGQIHTRPCH